MLSTAERVAPSGNRKQKNSRKDVMRAPAERGQHFAGVRSVARLAEDFAVQFDGRIRADHDAVFLRCGLFARRRAGLGLGQPRNHCLRGLAGT